MFNLIFLRLGGVLLDLNFGNLFLLGGVSSLSELTLRVLSRGERLNRLRLLSSSLTREGVLKSLPVTVSLLGVIEPDLSRLSRVFLFLLLRRPLDDFLPEICLPRPPRSRLSSVSARDRKSVV